MDQAIIIGIDLAKRVFQTHGARADDSVAFRKKLSRARLLPFLATQPKCTVAMGAGWRAPRRMTGRARSRSLTTSSGRSLRSM